MSLPGVERAEVSRGEALVAGDGYPTSYRLDISLEEIAPIDDGARVQVHVGTGHSAARVVRLGDQFAQLRLAAPVVAARGDRVILRGERRSAAGRLSTLSHRDTVTRLVSISSLGATSRPRSRHRFGSSRCASSTTVSWTASSDRGRGCSRRRGSPPTRTISECGSPRPIHSTPEFRCRRSLGRRRSSAPALRAARLEALSPRSRAAARGSRSGGHGARARARVRGCPRDEGRRRRARALPRGGRAARSAR